MSKTCRDCKWWIDEPCETGPRSCSCRVPDFPSGNFGRTCPAFDDGSFEKAVRDMLDVVMVCIDTIEAHVDTIYDFLDERESRKGEGEK